MLNLFYYAGVYFIRLQAYIYVTHIILYVSTHLLLIKYTCYPPRFPAFFVVR